MEYYNAMLALGVPNIEMHLYGNGRHPGDALPDGSRMGGGLTDRNGIPFGTWQYRFVDWFRDLGFLQKPGVETKAAAEVAAFLKQSARGRGGFGGGPDRQGQPASTNAPATPANPTGASPK